MKKTFVVGSLYDEKLKNSLMEKAQVIAFRVDDVVHWQNLDWFPKDKVKINFDPKVGKLVIEISVKNGEYLALGDMKGYVKKVEK